MRVVKTGLAAALVWTACGMLGAAGALAQEAAVGEPGEQLSPDCCGPSVIETMEQVVERDRLERLPENRKERGNKPGEWVVPGRGATTSPRSGEHNAVNKWGDTRMGIGFPGLVDVHGAYFCGQSGQGVWTTGLRVIGYRDGQVVQETDWFTEIGAQPAWFEMGLQRVDRIEIECVPVFNGGGWYALDDLTYSLAGQADRIVVDFDDVSFRTTLTATGYAGLTWETGTGDFFGTGGVPGPKSPPDFKTPAPPGADEEPLSGTRATGPTEGLKFEGVQKGDAGYYTFPPDSIGAIGPEHYVEAVNESFAIYSRDTGTEIYNVGLPVFMNATSGSGDPRILYDQHSQRYFVTCTNFSNRLYLAVSRTSDPTGSWFKTNFVMSTGDDTGCNPDYPTLGVDANGIYVSAFMYGCDSMTIWAIDKAPLVAASPYLGTVTAWRNQPFELAIQPAHTYGTPQGEYLISVADSNELRLRRVDGPLTSPSLHLLGTVTVDYFYEPPDAPAQGSSVDIDTVDERLMMSVYRDGSLWTAHTIRHGTSPYRAACRWYEIKPLSMDLIQSGTVADTTYYYYFPSIMVNRNGNVAMGFTGSHATEYAGCYYTGRLAGDPAGDMATPVLYKQGTGAQNNIDGLGRNRWGDYSYTTLDPLDEATFWTIQEFGRNTTNSIWSTYVCELSYGDGDCNANGIPDLCDLDCGRPGCDMPGCGASDDCNGNNNPDECEVPPIGPAENDCNGNSVPDDCDVDPSDPDANGQVSPDCQPNGVPDECDVDPTDPDGNGQVSADCQPNGVPDECDLAPPGSVPPHDDCADAELVCLGRVYSGTTSAATNTDGSASCATSSRDVWYYYKPFGNGFATISTAGSSFDTVLSLHSGCPGTSANEVACNDDYGGPQSRLSSVLVYNGNDYWIRVAGKNGAYGDFQLEIVTGPDCLYDAGDCNDNDVPDECDIASGYSQDCQPNGVPDECDIAAGTSLDENENGIPDECENQCLETGDCNCDGNINTFDIDPFVLALTGGQAAWEAQYSCDYLCACDCDGNGAVNTFDIDPFVAILTGP